MRSAEESEYLDGEKKYATETSRESGKVVLPYNWREPLIAACAVDTGVVILTSSSIRLLLAVSHLVIRQTFPTNEGGFNKEWDLPES